MSLALPHPETRGERRQLVALGVSTLAFAAALRLPEHVWLATGLAGVLATAATIAAMGSRWTRLWTGRWSLGVAAGLALTAATYGIYPILSDAWPALAQEVSELYATLSTPPGPRAAAPLLLAVVAVEELVWRGLAVELLSRRLDRPLYVGLAATALYALPQLASGSWVLVALALGCGAIWTGLRLMTGGLLAPLLCHAIWNVHVFVLWPVSG